MTDINARCRKVLEDIRKGKRTICAGNCENAPRFPEFFAIYADAAHVENTEIDSGFSSFNWINQTEKQAYSLVSDILRAAKVLGVGSGLWKERETKRTYRNPRGVGRDENQRPELTANNREEVIQGKCGGRMGGWGGLK